MLLLLCCHYSPLEIILGLIATIAYLFKVFLVKKNRTALERIVQPAAYSAVRDSDKKNFPCLSRKKCFAQSYTNINLRKTNTSSSIFISLFQYFFHYREQQYNAMLTMSINQQDKQLLVPNLGPEQATVAIFPFLLPLVTMEGTVYTYQYTV